MKIARGNPLWPNLTAASSLFMRMLLSFLSVTFPPEVYAGAVAAAANLPAEATSLQAGGLRGIAPSAIATG